MSENTFPSSLEAIEERIKQINPSEYGRTRNHKEGAVTRLSPYISRGVISTRQVYHFLQSLNLPWQEIGKLVQELAWRDYWQQVWIARGDAIDDDLKHKQSGVNHYQIPESIVGAKTQIEVIDEAIDTL